MQYKCPCLGDARRHSYTQGQQPLRLKAQVNFFERQKTPDQQSCAC